MSQRHKFELSLLERYPIVREDRENGRVYLHDGVAYPSVTTILNSYFDKSWIEAWKKRVGEAEAARILSQAQVRGTAMHALYEKYLLNENNFDEDAMPTNLMNFQQLRPLLDKCVTKVYGCELPVFSKTYNAAGTTDAVVEWRGKEPCVMDFKTSKKRKKSKDITNYFVQISIYGEMLNEMYGLNIQKGIILMTVDHESPIMFEADLNEYRPLVKKIFIESRNVHKGKAE